MYIYCQVSILSCDETIRYIVDRAHQNSLHWGPSWLTSLIWGLLWVDSEGGCVVLWAQKAHTEWQEKRGGTVAGAWAQEGNHSDSNNTLPLISLISSFLWLKVYYSGEISCCCGCSGWNAASLGHDATRSAGQGRATWGVLQLTLIFVPSSSGSGSGIISIWEHRKRQEEKESISNVIAACWVECSSQRVTLRTHSKM